MTYDARQVANWFVSRAQRDGKQLSIMSLLKLTYIAHGWHLETQNTPLFSNRIEAWQYGPVIPDVYNAFRHQGVVARQVSPTALGGTFDPKDETLLEQVWNIYGGLTAFRLSDITHVSGGPWDVASRIGGHYAQIPNELIQRHYRELRKKAQVAATNA